MNYFEIIALLVSFLAIIISLFTIFLAMMFYRLYSHLTLLITEMTKGLEMSTLRLERLPKILYNEQDIVVPTSAVQDSQTGKEKKRQGKKQHPDAVNYSQRQTSENKSTMQDKEVSSHIFSEGEEI